MPLPFEIDVQLADQRGGVHFVAIRDARRVAIGKYSAGDLTKRRALAKQWAENPALRNGEALSTAEIESALEVAEISALAALDDLCDEREEGDDDAGQVASHVDEDRIVEMAFGDAGVDFIVFDRHTFQVERTESIEVGESIVTPPRCWKGVCNSMVHLGGTVLLPTTYDEAGLDESMLRADVEAFIRRYAELPDDTTLMCVEYILLTWIHDAFDELAYLSFRTADAGRGKSRTLETIGSVCYRPLLAGGGSSPAALLRMLDIFGGTLCCDEFDMKRNSELAMEVTRIVNLGFQRGKPIIKCDGEDNEPRPFKCFGPKIFALRGRFTDDASESRIISVWMRQRTRADVPISLPRRIFDREALDLRNRLLAYRCANLGKIVIDPRHVDPRLEDRCNQIGAALMAVAQTAEARERIVLALLEQQQTVAAERSDSLAGEVLSVVLDTVPVGSIVRPKIVAAAINQKRAEDLSCEVDRLPKDTRIKPEKVAWILRAVLELPRGGRDRQGVYYETRPTRMRQLCDRYGASPVTVTTVTPSPSPPTVTENMHFEPANGDCDGRVGGDGRGDSPPSAVRTPSPDSQSVAEPDDPDLPF